MHLPRRSHPSTGRDAIEDLSHQVYLPLLNGVIPGASLAIAAPKVLRFIEEQYL
jgi:hypothetical protein